MYGANKIYFQNFGNLQKVNMIVSLDQTFLYSIILKINFVFYIKYLSVLITILSILLICFVNTPNILKFMMNFTHDL